MWLKCITCEALARPVYYCASMSANIVDVVLVERGLHNTPSKLRNYIQSIIDESNDKPYDAILLSYGLCGQATSGLVARSKPLVIPKAHDCITLFLGSRVRYDEQFQNHPGTYWYAQDYIERDDGTGTSLSMGSGLDVSVQSQYQQYVEKYGKDNADYLMEMMGGWQDHYNRAVYIDVGIGNGNAVENSAQAEAAKRGWSFERLEGDIRLIHQLIEGNWQDDYLVIPPEGEIIMTYDHNVIGCRANQ